MEGLSENQVLINRQKYGENKLPEPKLKTAWDFFCDVFSDKLNIILLILAIIFIALAVFGLGEISEALGLVFVLTLISVINISTGLKSQKYAKRMADMVAEHFCKVIRDGQIKQINTYEVVVDDVVLLESGDTICADGYLVSGNLEVDNSILNGESKLCKKEPVKDFVFSYETKISGETYVDKNSLFAGTNIQSGHGLMIVKRVGTQTENGKILLKINEIEAPKTSLDLQLEHLATLISKLGIIGAAIVGIILFITDVFLSPASMDLSAIDIFKSILSAFTLALTIVAAAVPEGLPLIINIVMAQNSKKLVKQNVLAKYANKIPEAGNINILCTDKTGTLTYANLTPVYNYMGSGKEIGFTDSLLNSMFNENIIINTTAVYDSNGKVSGGSFTSRALLRMIPYESGLIQKTLESCKVLSDDPFDSIKKYSAVEFMKDNQKLSYYMGAPERIIQHARFYLDESGKRHELSQNILNELIKKNAKKAMRLIAFAYSTEPLVAGQFPSDLTFVCMTALRDEIRAGVPEAVKDMHNANVQVVMITGDILDTAKAIAIDSGIFNEDSGDIAIDASVLESMSDSDILKILPNIKVIARAVPTTKLKMVDIAQKSGLCIGMCGDGTNDAPALKLADVGFGMGSGTDVCKAASDIIITDDNFVSVTKAVLLGRTFVHNMMMFLKFQLPINIFLMLMCLYFPVFYAVPAFYAVQILLINIVMDGLNSLAFGGEPTKQEYMREKVAVKGAPLLSRKVMEQILFSVASFVVIFCIFALPPVYNLFAGVEETARFVLMIFASMLNGFNVRTDSLNPLKDISKNLNFIRVAVLVFAGTVVLVSYAGSFVHSVPLTLVQWFVLFGLAFLVIPFGTLQKILKIGK